MKKTIQVTVSFPQTFQFEYEDTGNIEEIKEAIKGWASHLMESSPSEPVIVYSDNPQFVENMEEEDKKVLEAINRMELCFEDSEDYYDADSDDPYASSLPRIGQYEMVDFGIEWEGASSTISNENTPYAHYAHGYGSNPMAAFHYLLDVIAQLGFDVVGLQNRVLYDYGIDVFPTLPQAYAISGEFYHLGMRWNEL